MAFDGEPRRESKLALEILGDYISLFVCTGEGSIRRTSIPSEMWLLAVWLMRPGTDIEPEFFDHWAKRYAQEGVMTYAAGMARMIENSFDEERSRKWLPQMRDRATLDAAKEGFLAEQLRRELIWRERYGIDDDALPPALD